MSNKMHVQYNSLLMTQAPLMIFNPDLKHVLQNQTALKTSTYMFPQLFFFLTFEHQQHFYQIPQHPDSVSAD